jgi:hypothetical protein
MFGQRNTNDDDKAGAPAVPPAGTLNTSTGIPDDHAVSQMLSDTEAPSLSGPAPTTLPSLGDPAPSSAPAAPASPVTIVSPEPAAAEASTEDLIRMKQEALQHLQPLVGTLQQSPEEEFRTLMMMIQATDDRSMLKKALEAAKKIPDDKIRAQAMLDVVNEINYFTQVEQ